MNNLNKEKSNILNEKNAGDIQENQTVENSNFSLSPLAKSALIEVIIVILSFTGIPMGFNGEHVETFYGFAVLMVFIIIPILPITALYQLVFIIKNRKKISSDDKMFIKFAIFIFFAALLFATLINYY